MIYVEGPDLTAAIRRARHHAGDVEPLIPELALALFTSELHTDLEREHTLRQSKVGANSYGLYLDTGEQFHFRYLDYGGGRIEVYDRWTFQRDGVDPVYVIDSRESVWAFVEWAAKPVAVAA